MIILSLGSNLPSEIGDRFENINYAIRMLSTHGFSIIKKSCFYETPSYPDQSNPKFINVVISVKNHKSLASLNYLIKTIFNIEEVLGRKRNKKNDPRTCDIDIIDYENKVLDFSIDKIKIIIPHEKLNNRNFVLIPLQEIYPNWKHPKTKEYIYQIIKNLSDIDKKSILKI